MTTKLIYKVILFVVALLALWLVDQPDWRQFLFVFSGIGFWSILSDLISKKP